MTVRRLFSHLLAAAAYGSLLQALIFSFLLLSYHAVPGPTKTGFVTFFEIAGHRFPPFPVVVGTVISCTLVPLLVAFFLARRAPRLGLDRAVPIFVHLGIVALAILAHGFLLIIGSFMGQDGAF